MRLTFIALVFLLSRSTAEGTAVVVFRSDTHIIIASDSAVQRRGAGEAGQQQYLKCKIAASGQWWFSVPGYSGNGAELDVQQLAGRALTSARTLAEAKDALVKTVYPRVRDGLKAARASTHFAELYHAGNPVSNLIVAGMDGGVLSVAILVILLDTIEPFALRAVWLSCPGSWCDEAGRVFYGTSISETGPAVRLLKPPLLPWVAKGDGAAAHRIITLQIRSSPTIVTGPIDVLELSVRGSRWVKHDPLSTCKPL